jgi:hypothetical protein
VKVGDVVRWTLPELLAHPARPKAPSALGVIVKMRIGNGANVAWFGDDMRVTWTPLMELEVVSES